MKLSWSKFHNTQKYSDCQLITAVNAYYYYTGIHIDQDSKRYEGYVDLCGAQHGSAISIEKVHHRLHLSVVKTYEKHDLSFLRLGDREREMFLFPMEVSVWYAHYGFHSVLAVDYEPKTDCIRVCNFDKHYNHYGWHFFADFRGCIDNMNKPWAARSFAFKGEYGMDVEID